MAVSQHATPAEVEDILRRRQALEVERGIIGREAAIGIDVTDRLAKVEAGLVETETTLAAAQARWDREKLLVSEILDLRARLRGEGLPLDAATGEETAAEPESAEAMAAEEKATKSKDTKAERTRKSKVGNAGAETKASRRKMEVHGRKRQLTSHDCAP